MAIKKEQENMALSPRRTFFEPEYESLEDILRHTNPKDKSVLAVAAYGGYPLAFLAEGARNVLSFDVSRRQIAWNHFLKASILALDYKQNRALFNMLIKSKYSGRELMAYECDRKVNPILQEKIMDVERKVSRLVPRMYREEAKNEMSKFRLYNPNKIAQIYPHLKDRDAYNQVREAVKGGRWEIAQSELLGLLERESEVGRSFDVMYTSSIRNWVLYRMYSRETKKFGEYDKKLGELVNKLLNAGGIFYEVLVTISWGIDDDIPHIPFPRVRIPQEFYHLSIQSYPSRYGSGTTIIIGKKQ